MNSDYNPFSLKGKTILVTGASSGIGKGVAETCAKMGATVLINGRNAERLQETYTSLQPEKRQIYIADLTDSIQTNQLVTNLPLLDGVVHCAGIGHSKICKFINEEDIDSVMNANFKMTVMLQTKLIQHKKLKKASSVIFIASRAAESPSIGNAIYSASKGAIISYARCLMLEMAPRQIRVNCICPSMVWSNLIHQGDLLQENLEQAQLQYPLKRFGKPEDVAHLAIYMLSDASTWMTGSSVDITGGENNIQTLIQR